MKRLALAAAAFFRESSIETQFVVPHVSWRAGVHSHDVRGSRAARGGSRNGKSEIRSPWSHACSLLIPCCFRVCVRSFSCPKSGYIVITKRKLPEPPMDIRAQTRVRRDAVQLVDAETAQRLCWAPA